MVLPPLHRARRLALAQALGLLLLLCQAVAEGPRASFPTDLYPDTAIQAPESKIQAPKSEARTAAGRHGAEGPNGRRSLHQFKDKKGTLVLTNRPEKYLRRKGYVEVEITYSRVVVPQQYQRFTSAAQYTSGTIRDVVKRYSAMYALDENLVYAVIKAESNFNPYAVSSKGCRGLMQLAPGTAAEVGVTDMFDPAQNIAGGTQYLAKMLNLFNNDIELALAGYNAGPNAVLKYGGVPPYQETRDYVRRVRRHVGDFAGRRAKPLFQVTSKKPKADALPAQKRLAYVIHFKSGYTQPADKVLDEDPYLYVQYGKRTALIRKEHVEKVVGPA